MIIPVYTKVIPLPHSQNRLIERVLFYARVNPVFKGGPDEGGRIQGWKKTPIFARLLGAFGDVF